VEPLITCIVAVFNGESYLAEALDSMLAQTHPSLDVLVVDDGSTDGTPAVIDRYGDAVRRMWKPNGGPASARNLALRHLRGEFVAFLDADDLWHPEKLARQMARFEARPELEMSLTLVQNFWVPELEDEAERFRDHRLAKPASGYSTVALLARRTVFDRVGRFNEEWRHVHDTEWFLRASDTGVVVELLPEVLVSRRLHPHSRSRLGGAVSREEYLRLVKDRVSRQRRPRAN
jgi:glycosyltransferase involved in cell wall biosynthesis